MTIRSIYIPRLICQSPSDEMIKGIMEKHQIGKVTTVDIIRKINYNNNKPYYSAFVYFDEIAQINEDVLKNISDNGFHKLVLDNCYWILFKNKNHVPEHERILRNSTKHLTDADYSNILDMYSSLDWNVARKGDLWRCAAAEVGGDGEL